MSESEETARKDWEQRIYRRLTDTANADPSLSLPPPQNPHADSATGHVRLSWDPVPDAAGYVIERASESTEPHILLHGGSDVAAVPETEFADTGIKERTDYQYRIAAVPGADYPAWEWSAPVQARSNPRQAAPLNITVDAAAHIGQLNRIWRMVGSERLSQLLLQNQIAKEFADALKIAHDDLGVTTVRAHAILHDDNAVAARDAKTGDLDFDFTKIDAIYDQLKDIGLRPVVELSFMPKALAKDPDQTVFAYRGIISPPADWADWQRLVSGLATHLIARYGLDEVANWPFEVWNEPNLEVFWVGTMADYLRLYDESAQALKRVNPRLKVGGPATAAGEWIEELTKHARQNNIPLDFITSHTYGNLPLDARPSLRRNGFEDIPIWWTEWGIGSTHYGPVHDRPLGAPFVLSGFKSAQTRMDAVAYWVISDHFEELGRPQRLFHNGFGLLTVGNLRKPRYWAVHLAEHLGDQVLESTVTGDGADVLVQAWATRHDDGTTDILVWNGTINAALANGDPRLDRRIRLEIHNLPAKTYYVELARVDEHHSNITSHCPPDVAWPDEALWADLRAKDELYTERLPDLQAGENRDKARFEFSLPMPGIVRIRLEESQR